MASPSEQARCKTESSHSRDDENKVVGDLLTSLQNVQVGMKLEAKDAYGKWYIAKVVEIQPKEDEVLVHFERWNSRYDEYVKMSSGRLRVLVPERRETLQKESDKLKKNLVVGDMVQARWEDGRMYFGKVLKLYKCENEVDVLFDDGVQYRAPLSSVRKRSNTSRSHLSKSTLCESDSSQTANSRSLRAKKRHKSEGSASQASCSSPPSSPVFMPPKKRKILDSDSSYSDSDDTSGKSLDGTIKLPRLRKRIHKLSVSASSDSDTSLTPTPNRRRKKMCAELTIKSIQHLSPVKEHSEIKMDTMEKSLPNQVDESPTTFSTTIPVENKEAVPVIAESNDTGTKGVKKSPTLAKRTRAHTKFENVPLRRSDPKKPVKMAPKEMVIVWDHNEFKCKVTGCNKSFRKDSLLQSHIKHYHSLHRTVRQKTVTGHSAVSEKKENTSNSPTSDLTKSKRHSLSPAMESLQATTASTQQVIKQPKVSLKSGTRKNQKSVEVVKDNETVSYPPNGNQNEHQSTQLNSTSTVKHSSKTAKRNGGLSLASPHLKVPLVEIKAISKDSISSPKKRSKSDSLSKGEDGFSTDVCMEDVGGVVSPKGGLHNGNDVVHCVCGDVTDEGFMIQCEECLCWQHGDCLHMTESSLPNRYICHFCSNRPGLRNRLRYQFDKDWFGNGSLPSVRGGPQFPHSSLIKHTHQLTDCLYQIKKVLHSSKVKLQAVGRVNHPYMRQWAKECSHIEKEDISPYLISALLPVSLSPNRNDSPKQPTNGVPCGNGVCNDTKEVVPSNSGEVINLNTLQLDPLPHLNENLCATGTGDVATCSPDPKTLKLAPLPAIKKENLTTDKVTKSLSSPTTNETNSSSSVDAKVVKTEPHEVLNNEFGVQELSVFAVTSEQAKTPPPTNTQSKPVTLTPIKAPTLVTVTTLYPNSTPLTAGPPQTVPSKSLPESFTPKLTSTMDSVSLEEFSDAFMQGDTTNWYQRMKLLDHIEGVQERVCSYMESIENQLEKLPPETEGLEKVEELLLQVQSTMTQLRHVQVV